MNKNVEMYGVRINLNNTFMTEMFKIKGVGRSTILQLTKKMGIKIDTRMKELSEDQWQILNEIFTVYEKNGRYFGEKLSMKVMDDIKEIMSVNSFRSRVHRPKTKKQGSK